MEEQIDLVKVDKIVTDCILSDEENKSTRIGLFEEMIKNGMVDVNNALPIIVKEMKSIADLGMIVICLRHGADRNSYINVRGMGPAHILIYAYDVHFIRNKKLFEMFYNIMVLNGASTMLPSYDSKIHKNNVYDRTVIQMESVYEWMRNNGKNSFTLLPVASEILRYIKSDETQLYDKEVYAIYLNDTTIIKWNVEMLSYMLNSRNSNWKNIKPNIKELDSTFLKVAVNATFLDLVIAMLDDGMRPSYTDFSFWIYHYKHIYTFHNVEYLIEQCEDMFIELIRRGFQVDLYYLDEIGSVNPQFRITLFDEYEKPLYSKVCNYKEDQYIPDEMKDVAVYLGIPEGFSKKSFCNSVEHVTSADLDSLLKANQKRNSQAIGSKLNFLTDFINNNGLGYCDNKEDFTDNPLDYPNNLLAYYKDNENKTWCFLSKDFENLIYTKINPSTKQILPSDFLDRLENQTKLLKFFKIPLSEPKTISKMIAEIKKNDTPSNDKTNAIIQKIKNVLLIKGMTEDTIINKMKIRDIINKFKKIEVNIQDILLISNSELDKTISTAKIEFSPKIMFILICVTLDESFDKDVGLIEIFLK